MTATLEAPGETRRVGEALRVAAASCAVAGLLHLAAVPEHIAASLLVGGFFLAVGCAQLLITAVLVVEPPGTRVLAVLASAHLALIALYVATRTTDLPFAPVHAAGRHVDASAAAAAAPGGEGNGVPLLPGSRIEPVGPLDLVCVVAEVVLVAALVVRLPRRARTAVLDVALLLALALAALRLVG